MVCIMWTQSWCNVELVSVIYCSNLLQPTVAVSLWVVTAPWWTTEGIKYESPCCTAVVGSYSSIVPSTWHARLWACLLCLAINWKSSRVVLCCFESMAVLVHGHVAIITEAESTLHHNQVHLVVQRSCLQSRKQSRRRPGNEASAMCGHEVVFCQRGGNS